MNTNKAAYVLLLLMLIWLPIPLGSNRPWAWSIFELMACLSALMALWSAKLCDIKARLRHFSGLFDVLVVVQLFVAIQLLPINDGDIISFDPYQTQVALLKGICYCLFVFCCCYLLHTQKRIMFFCYAIVASALFQALYAIYLQYGGFAVSPVFELRVKTQASGSFVYHNHLANFLLLGSALLIGLLISQLSRKQHFSSLRRNTVRVFEALLSIKWLLRVAIVCLVIALILTRSRMGNSAFLVSLIAASVLALVLMKRPPTMLKWLVVSFVVIDIALVGAMFGIDKVKERIDSSSFQGESRDEVVAMSIPIIKEHWFTGTGAGTFYTVFPGYHQETMSGLYDHAHNEYIQFSVEYGLVITLFLGGAVIFSLWNAFVALQIRKSAFYQGLAFGCVMAITGMLMHMSVDFPLQSPANAVTFLALLVLATLSRYGKSEKAKTQTEVTASSNAKSVFGV